MQITWLDENEESLIVSRGQRLLRKVAGVRVGKGSSLCANRGDDLLPKMWQLLLLLIVPLERASNGIQSHVNGAKCVSFQYRFDICYETATFSSIENHVFYIWNAGARWALRALP